MRAQVVISNENPASQNILRALLATGGFEKVEDGFWKGKQFDIAEYSGRIIDIVPSRDADFYVFASTHKSERGSPNFTAHTPGNWGAAEMGGQARTLNFAFGSAVAAAARKMKGLSDASLKWEVSIEADHHGPTLSKPVLFVEIGSTEKEWGNPEAGKIAAEGVIAAASASAAESVLVGFGGSHYCPKFGPKAISGSAVFGHIVPGYSLEKGEIEEEMVRQAIGRNVEKVEAAAIDWKGIKGASRATLITTLESIGIKWVRM